MDYRASLIAAVVLNVNKKKGTKPTQPHDLIPRRSQDRVRQRGPAMSAETMLAYAKQWTVLLGGTITEVN